MGSPDTRGNVGRSLRRRRRRIARAAVNVALQVMFEIGSFSPCDDLSLTFRDYYDIYSIDDMKQYIVETIEEVWGDLYPEISLTESIVDKVLRLCPPEEFFYYSMCHWDRL